jgi:DNA-binding NtrC family response regulator
VAVVKPDLEPVQVQDVQIPASDLPANVFISLLGRLARRHHVPARTFSAIGRRRLTSYAWPGNVRELSHELQRALVFEEGDTLNLDTLMGAVGSDTASIGASTAPSATGPTAGESDPQEAWFNASYRFPDSGFSLEDAILQLIRHALNQTGGNVSAAARKLGVSRDYLRYRLGGWKDGEKPPAATPAGE